MDGLGFGQPYLMYSERKRNISRVREKKVEVNLND